MTHITLRGARLSLLPLLLIALTVGCSTRAETSGQEETHATLVVVNSSPEDRTEELVEVPWSDVVERLGITESAVVRVSEAGGDQELAHQVVPAAGPRPARLVLLATVAAGDTLILNLEPAEAAAAVEKRASVVHMAERDDIAWENDRVAFRTYGEGLWQLEDLVSSGIDVFTKRTADLVLERWYASGDYHTDHGEGADFFMVGRTLGGGGTAAFLDGAIVRAPNFRRHDILADGPLMAIVRLEYGPWEAAGRSFEEERVVSIAAGQDGYRQDTRITSNGHPVPVAAGLIRRDGVSIDSGSVDGWTWTAHYGPVSDPGYGDLGTAVIVRSATDTALVENHDVVVAEPDSSFATHYVASCWSEAAACADASAWVDRVEGLAGAVASPLDVSWAD